MVNVFDIMSYLNNDEDDDNCLDRLLAEVAVDCIDKEDEVKDLEVDVFYTYYD